VTASVVTGQYVDPKAGRIAFKTYAEQWREAQVHRPSSAAHVETMLRRHAYPTLGERPLSSILPSEVQAWVKRLSVGGTGRQPLAPSTVGVVHGIVSSIFKAAVRDRRVMANPCEGTKLPTVEKRKVAPMTTEQVETSRKELPDALKALVTFAAGTGMRQGEVLGLTRDRLRLLGANPVVVVDRQLVTLRSGKTEFGPRRRSGLHARRSAHHSAGLRARVAAGRKGRRAERSDGNGDARAASLLRLVADPVRREREDRAGPSGARDRGRDAGHLQPHLAGFGRPDTRRDRQRSRSPDFFWWGLYGD